MVAVAAPSHDGKMQLEDQLWIRSFELAQGFVRRLCRRYGIRSQQLIDVLWDTILDAIRSKMLQVDPLATKPAAYYWRLAYCRAIDVLRRDGRLREHCKQQVGYPLERIEDGSSGQDPEQLGLEQQRRQDNAQATVLQLPSLLEAVLGQREIKAVGMRLGFTITNGTISMIDSTATLKEIGQELGLCAGSTYRFIARALETVRWELSCLGIHDIDDLLTRGLPDRRKRQAA